MALLRRTCFALLLAATLTPLASAQTLPDPQEILRAAREKIRATWPDEAERQPAYAAVRELVATLQDPGSHFLTPADARAYRAPEATSFAGIGAVLEAKTDEASGETRVLISSVLPDGPAAKSALRPGDALVQIDQTPLAGKRLSEVVKLIRGGNGTPVTLRVLRPGGAEPLEVRLVRATVTVRSTQCGLLDPETNLGYLWVRALQPATVREVREALTDLQQQGVRGVLLDLSLNAEGAEEAALQIAGLLTAQSPVAWRQVPNQEPQPLAPGATPLLPPDLPLVVLVGSATAGFAEALAGTLQEHRQAVLVGQRSAGAANVREAFDLADGSLLVLPTGRYLTADKRDPAAADAAGNRGLAPDVSFPAPDPQVDVKYRQWHEAQVELARAGLVKLLRK